MTRMQNVVTKIFALVVVAGVTASTSAYALPHLGVHRHPAIQQADQRVSVQVNNKGFLFRDIKVDGHIYTLLPNHCVTIKAPEGTEVFAASTGGRHHKGDLLFAVNHGMQGAIVNIN